MSTPVQLWRYVVPPDKQLEWAIFVLGSDGYFSAVSDFGAYAYLWRDHGCADFREFLCEAQDDWEYFARKLAGGRREYDAEATIFRIKSCICEMRRKHDLTREQARAEWNLLRSTIARSARKGAIYDWHEDTHLPDVPELIAYSLPSDVTRFAKRLLPRLVPILRADIERERAASAAATEVAHAHST